MGYYPIFLELKDRHCVVIGGGAVAERKVDGLLQAGARVTVVSPSLTSKLAYLVSQGGVCHVAR
ncbi:MAG: hypothetical protein HYY45_09840, partial [Deltaproteobacteria bacterium]|nr:hypothetical protein [Deltaproteobacteria bacterium]